MVRLGKNEEFPSLETPHNLRTTLTPFSSDVMRQQTYSLLAILEWPSSQQALRRSARFPGKAHTSPCRPTGVSWIAQGRFYSPGSLFGLLLYPIILSKRVLDINISNAAKQISVARLNRLPSMGTDALW